MGEWGIPRLFGILVRRIDHSRHISAVHSGPHVFNARNSDFRQRCGHTVLLAGAGQDALERTL